MFQVNWQNKEQAHSVVNSLAGKTVLIVGDIGLDEYIMGEVSRISPEAPVPVVSVTHKDYRLGLSGNVAQNVTSLGGEALFLTVVGEDTIGKDVSRLLEEKGVRTEGVLVDSARPTTMKSRVMSGDHHIVRVDQESLNDLSQETRDRLVKSFESLLPKADIVVVQDYAKGVICEDLVASIVDRSQKAGIPVLTDPHRTAPLSRYRGVDLIKPNHEESLILSKVLKEKRGQDISLDDVAAVIKEKTDAKNVVITRGKEGMAIFDSEGNKTQVPTFARQVYDVTGAGDTVIATLALGLASGLNLEDSCCLANFAAGVVVAKVGCVPCDKEELKSTIEKLSIRL